MHEIISQWCTWLTACGRPPSTLRLRTHQLLRFADHHPNLVDVTAADMVSWLANPDWSPNTKASNRAALRSFYGWAHCYGHVPVDESRKLPSVKVPPPVPNPAPEAVIKRGLLTADQRDRLMLELAAHLGLRRGEISRVHTDDVIEDLTGSGRARPAGCSLRLKAGTSPRATWASSWLVRSPGIGPRIRSAIGSQQWPIQARVTCWRCSNCWDTRTSRRPEATSSCPRTPCGPPWRPRLPSRCSRSAPAR